MTDLIVMRPSFFQHYQAFPRGLLHQTCIPSSNMSIEPGRIVRIHSLKSDAGKKLNGSRAAVLRPVEDGARFQVTVEFSYDDETKAIKPENLTLEERLPLPSDEYGNNRGVCMTPAGDQVNRKLCELLLWYRDDYRPPETMLIGYAGMAFSRMGQSNFMYFTAGQMEQMAGVLALANTCMQAEEAATSDVLFALLEGERMYLETLAQTLYWTGYIGPEEENEKERDFDNCPPTALTPDQTKAAYIQTMKEGPLLLLREMTKYQFGQALYAALKQCQFYHLLVQRLLRFTAREALKTSDGKALGKMARTILGRGILSDINVTPISEETAENILQNAGSVLRSPEAATDEAIKNLLGIS